MQPVKDESDHDPSVPHVALAGTGVPVYPAAQVTVSALPVYVVVATVYPVTVSRLQTATIIMEMHRKSLPMAPRGRQNIERHLLLMFQIMKKQGSQFSFFHGVVTVL